MVSRAIQIKRLQRKAKAGKQRKRIVRRDGTTPSFASVFMGASPTTKPAKKTKAPASVN